MYFTLTELKDIIIKELQNESLNISDKNIYDIIEKIENGFNLLEISNELKLEKNIVDIVYEVYSFYLIEQKEKLKELFIGCGIEFFEKIDSIKNLYEVEKVKLNLKFKAIDLFEKNKELIYRKQKIEIEISQKYFDRKHKDFIDNKGEILGQRRFVYKYRISDFNSDFSFKNREKVIHLCNIIEDGKVFEDLQKEEDLKNIPKEVYDLCYFHYLEKKNDLYAVALECSYIKNIDLDIEKMFEIKKISDLEDYIYNNFVLKEFKVEDYFKKEEQKHEKRLKYNIDMVKKTLYNEAVFKEKKVKLDNFMKNEVDKRWDKKYKEIEEIIDTAKQLENNLIKI